MLSSERHRCTFLSTVARAALAATALVLAACGYQPLYGQGETAPAVTAHFKAIEVAPIPDRVGQQVRTALERRLHVSGASATHYRLHVTLTETRQNLAEEKTGDVTRANLILRGDYTLTRTADETPLLKGSAQMVASFNILDSQFATLSAEKDARTRAAQLLADEIILRLALYFRGPYAEGKDVLNRGQPK